MGGIVPSQRLAVRFAHVRSSSITTQLSGRRFQPSMWLFVCSWVCLDFVCLCVLALLLLCVHSSTPILWGCKSFRHVHASLFNLTHWLVTDGHVFCAWLWGMELAIPFCESWMMAQFPSPSVKLSTRLASFFWADKLSLKRSHQNSNVILICWSKCQHWRYQMQSMHLEWEGCEKWQNRKAQWPYPAHTVKCEEQNQRFKKQTCCMNSHMML